MDVNDMFLSLPPESKDASLSSLNQWLKNHKNKNIFTKI